MSHVSVFISPASNPTAMTPSAIFIHYYYYYYYFCGSERRLCRRHKQASVPGPRANEGTSLLSRALSTITCRNLV